jgi:hypothetical protein
MLDGLRLVEFYKFDGLILDCVHAAVDRGEPNRDLKTLSPDDARDAAELFDELYLKYTMEREREVHLRHSDRFGIVCNPAMSGAGAAKADSEDVLFF